MRITNAQLSKIIKEELRSVLEESLPAHDEPLELSPSPQLNKPTAMTRWPDPDSKQRRAFRWLRTLLGYYKRAGLWMKKYAKDQEEETDLSKKYDDHLLAEAIKKFATTEEALKGMLLSSYDVKLAVEVAIEKDRKGGQAFQQFLIVASRAKHGWETAWRYYQNSDEWTPEDDEFWAKAKKNHGAWTQAWKAFVISAPKGEKDVWRKYAKEVKQENIINLKKDVLNVFMGWLGMPPKK